ncbi:Uncharacterised protein [uncultured archaeon]|nr:Uncharacterised protein [uncultured archaeon]
MKKRVKRSKSVKYNKKNSEEIFFIPIRYLILFFLTLFVPVIYWIFTPLTIYSVVGVLKIFYDTSVSGNVITINPDTVIRIIPACVAGSAYLLLLIINLAVPMSAKKRVYSILLSFLLLLVINILRILLLSVLYYYDFAYFNLTHVIFWYVLSTIFVIGIWLSIVKIFSIKEIPIYSDFKEIYKISKRFGKK